MIVLATYVMEAHKTHKTTVHHNLCVPRSTGSRGETRGAGGEVRGEVAGKAGRQGRQGTKGVDMSGTQRPREGAKG